MKSEQPYWIECLCSCGNRRVRKLSEAPGLCDQCERYMYFGNNARRIGVKHKRVKIWKMKHPVMKARR